jgi:predicted nucleic acid-binding protein
MIFDDIAAGSTVFLDSNTLIFHFTAHAKYGAACTRLLDRIEQHHIEGVCSAHVLAETIHRLMTIEAMNQLGWPATRLAARLKKHHAEIPNLGVYQRALTRVAQIGIRVLPLTETAIVAATGLCRQFDMPSISANRSVRFGKKSSAVLWRKCSSVSPGSGSKPNSGGHG